MTASWEGITLDDFPCQTHDLIRYSDLDPVGHVNNTAYANYFEAGRLDFLYDGGKVKEHATNGFFVLVQFNINFRKEMSFPGRVDVGTGVQRVGRTSIGVISAIYNDGICRAISDSILVYMGKDSRKSEPLPQEALDHLETLKVTFQPKS